MKHSSKKSNVPTGGSGRNLTPLRVNAPCKNLQELIEIFSCACFTITISLLVTGADRENDSQKYFCIAPGKDTHLCQTYG